MKEKFKFIGSDYSELVIGKDDNELKEIAEKHFIELPAKDLSIFKCIFAYVNKENLNGCTLPKEEVEKSLGTLTGKAVDFDHYRKMTVGHWLEAKLEDDKIMAYGVFYKGNHYEAYDELQAIMSTGNLGVSFEAWGDKTGDNKHYTLSNIEWAGGAILPTTKPAFPGAKVLEMSNNIRKKIESLHEASFSVYDFDTIMRVCMECKAPEGLDPAGFYDIEMIDFMNGEVYARWISFVEEGVNDLYKISINPQLKKANTEGFIKIIKSSTNTGGSLDNKTKVEESKDMEQELKDLKAQMEALTASIASKDAEIAELKKSLEEATASIEAAKTELANVKSELEKATADKQAEVEKAAKEAKLVAERRAELGEFAKALSDADLLDDKNYTIAKKDKEIAELKAKPTGQANLEAGSSKQETETDKKRKKIQEFAFGKN